MMKQIITSIVLTFIIFLISYFNDFVYSLLFALIPILSGIIGIISSSKLFGSKSKLGKFSLLIAIAYLMWGIAEVIWFYYEQFLEVFPYPSIADVFYILAYFPIMLSLIYVIKWNIKVVTKRLIFNLLLLAITSFITFVLIDMYNRRWEITNEEALLNIIYPELDLILIALISTAIFLFEKGILEKFILLILIANLISLIGDIAFSFSQILEIEFLYVLSDIPFLFDYITVTISYITIANILRKVKI